MKIDYEQQDDDLMGWKRWHILINGNRVGYAWFKYALGGWRLWLEGDAPGEWDTRGVIESNDMLEALVSERFNQSIKPIRNE